MKTPFFSTLLLWLNAIAVRIDFTLRYGMMQNEKKIIINSSPFTNTIPLVFFLFTKFCYCLFVLRCFIYLQHTHTIAQTSAYSTAYTRARTAVCLTVRSNERTPTYKSDTDQLFVELHNVVFLKIFLENTQETNAMFEFS